MSKAFTSDDVPVAAPPPPMPVGRRPITARGMAALQQQMQQLVETERPPLAAAAAAEDAEARAKLHALDARAHVLQRRMQLCDVVPVLSGAPSAVALGTSVHVRDANGQTFVYALVGPDEVDVPKRYISHASPIGQALLGLQVGAWATIERPAGVREVEVLRIEVSA